MVKLANQVQQKGKASAKQVYVLWDKEVLINPTRKADEQIVIKIGPAGAPIKESEEPIVIDNLDQSDVEKISKGADVNNHETRISTWLLRTSNRHGALRVCRERKSANSSVLVTGSLSKKG